MGGAGQGDAAYGDDQTDWIVGAGATFGLGDIAILSVGGAMGDGWRIAADADFWAASAYLRFDMSEATFAEISYGYEDWDDITTRQVVNGGVYWAPVDQLQIGVQADWTKVNPDAGDSEDQMTASFVSWWSF
jgi:hypothetical protein